ncbi:MAG: ADP-ribosylglycohydrolase family protein [Armatimonadota bacterium]
MSGTASLAVVLCFIAAMGAHAAAQAKVTMPFAEYLDKVHGAWLGELAGNMFGWPHELKYWEQPGPEITFRPDYTEGAVSDDDTDIEYVYLHALEEHGIGLTYEQVAAEWTSHVKRKVWVANKRALELMNEGMIPPATGHPANNDKAWFNLSGQFTQELWGMVSPGMPATAQRYGDKFAHVVVYGESVLAAHYFDVMYAEAFFEGDVEKLVAVGMSALPPESEYHQIVSDVVGWHEEEPDDWRAQRQRMHAKYGEKWNANSSVMNGGACTMALLYGGGDFERTILLACMIGYDADCNAATVGGLLGVVKGAEGLSEKWLRPLGDTYKNVTRDGLPAQEKIADIAARIAAVGRKVVEANGGYAWRDGDREMLTIMRQRPFVATLDPPP